MQEQEIIKRIQYLSDVRGWTLYRLSKESGITYSTLCTMIHKATAPSIPTLVKLCQGFGITLSEFFDSGNAWATLSQEQKEHLLQWDSLNSDNRQAAQKYIRYLLDEQLPANTGEAEKDPQ